MTEIEVLPLPNLKIFSIKASAYLMERLGLYETLFLDFPKEMEFLIEDLAGGRLTYEEFMDEVGFRRLIPEPMGSWEYTAEPLLKILHNLKHSFPQLEIHCYRTKEHEFRLNEVASSMACLTLQTAMTGRVDIREWRRVLEDNSQVGRETLIEERRLVNEKAYGRCICLSDLSGRLLKHALSEKGHLVWTKYIAAYHFTPLEILERRWRRETLSDDEIEGFVRYHLEYLRDYIYLSSNRDEAYYKWVYDKVPWLRNRTDREAIRFLDFLKPQPGETCL